jgi:hypothetical protein
MNFIPFRWLHINTEQEQGEMATILTNIQKYITAFLIQDKVKPLNKHQNSEIY